MSSKQVTVEVDFGLSQEHSEQHLMDILHAGALNLIRNQKDLDRYKKMYPGLRSGPVRIVSKGELVNSRVSE